MTKFKLSTKEKSAISELVAFMQGLKDCENEKEYLLNEAFKCRMIISYGNKGDSFLCANLINSIIPYLLANKDESVDEVAEECDNATDKMFDEIANKLMETSK